MSGSFPNLSANGVNTGDTLTPFHLWAGESPITTGQGLNGAVALEFGTVIALAGDRLVPYAPATGALTFATQPSANDTITIGGQAITFGPGGGQSAIGASTTITATNLAARINTNPALYGVRARSAGNVVTLSAIQSGQDGNGIPIVASGASPTLSGAATAGATSRPCGFAAAAIPANTWGPYYDGGSPNWEVLKAPAGLLSLAALKELFAGTPIHPNRLL